MNYDSVFDLMLLGGQAIVRTVHCDSGVPGIVQPEPTRTTLLFWACDGQFTLFPDNNATTDLIGMAFEAAGPSVGDFRLPLVLNLQTHRQIVTMGFRMVSTSPVNVTIMETFDRNKPVSPDMLRYRRKACRVR